MENESVYCPKCMRGMERRGYFRYACNICKKLWYIAPEGIVSDKKLAERHKGVPLDIG